MEVYFYFNLTLLGVCFLGRVVVFVLTEHHVSYNIIRELMVF